VSTQVLTALISGLVALVVAGGGGLITWTQIRRERDKWQVEIKTAYALELHKTRLSSYPEVFCILSRLSHGADVAVSAEIAGEVARELNSWFYSTGGMCADETTRGAILGLRVACEQWARTRTKPPETYAIRNIAIRFLRRDLDLEGLESYDFDKPSTILQKLRAELSNIEGGR
jgi:hypothetical protein